MKSHRDLEIYNEILKYILVYEILKSMRSQNSYEILKSIKILRFCSVADPSQKPYLVVCAHLGSIAILVATI